MSTPAVTPSGPATCQICHEGISIGPGKCAKTRDHGVTISLIDHSDDLASFTIIPAYDDVEMLALTVQAMAQGAFAS